MKRIWKMSVVRRVQSLLEYRACLILALSLISSNLFVFYSWLSVWESVLHCELKMLKGEVHIRWDSSSIDWQNIWEIGKCRGASEKCCFLSKSQQPYLSHICLLFGSISFHIWQIICLVYIGENAEEPVRSAAFLSKSQQLHLSHICFQSSSPSISKRLVFINRHSLHQ